MDNKFKFLMGMFVLIILVTSVNAQSSWWLQNYTYSGSDQGNNTWVTDSTPVFKFEPLSDNRTSWTHANISANGIVIATIPNVVNNTNYTYEGTFYGDGTSTNQIVWGIELFQTGVTAPGGPYSTNLSFGVDANAPNITEFYPLDLVTSAVANNSFNFTADDVNEDSAILYLSTDPDLMQINKSIDPGAANMLNGTITSWGNLSTNGFNEFSLLNGTIYWDISVNDSAGNIAYASGGASTYLTLFVDPDAPVIVGQPAANENTTKTSQYFNVTCNDANPNNAKLTIDGIDNITIAYTAGNKVEFGQLILSEGVHTYNMTCDDDMGNSASTTTYSIQIDETSPVVTINNVNNAWEQDSLFEINITLVEDNPMNCTTYANWTDAGDLSIGANVTNTSTALSFTGEILHQVDLADTTYPNGYNYNVVCVDQAGNVGNTTYQTVQVDTVNPLGMFLIHFKDSTYQNYTFGETLQNGSIGTEVVQFPVAWGNDTAIDVNFEKFTINIDDNQDMSSPTCTVYETDMSVNWTTFNCTLSYDQVYYYEVNASDYSGRVNGTQEQNGTFQYTTSTPGSIIYPGYNYISIWRDDATAHGVLNTSDLQTELGPSISTISIYNSTGDFQTYDVDTPSINGDIKLYRGIPAIVYNNGTSNVVWGGNRYYNIELGNVSAYDVKLSNNSNPWHLLGMLNYTGMKFQDLEDELGNSSGYTAAFAYNGSDYVIALNVTDVDGINPIPSISFTNETQTYSYFPTWGDPWNETTVPFGLPYWLEIMPTYTSICYNTTSGDNPRFC